MDILDDMGVSKLSAKVFSKVNYSIKLKKHFSTAHGCVAHLSSISPQSSYYCSEPWVVPPVSSFTLHNAGLYLNPTVHILELILLQH